MKPGYDLKTPIKRVSVYRLLKKLDDRFFTFTNLNYEECFLAFKMC